MERRAEGLKQAFGSVVAGLWEGGASGVRLQRFARRLDRARASEAPVPRAGAVRTAEEAHALWAREIAPMAGLWPEDELRARLCDHCPDGARCDWDGLGCDRQENVTRYLGGRALPLHR